MVNFNVVKMMQNIVTRTSKGFSCKKAGHFVSPQVIGEHVERKEYRFLATCMACGKQLMYDCLENNDGDLMQSVREYNAKKDLKPYFAKILENQYTKVEDVIPTMADHELRPDVYHCQVCQQNSSFMRKYALCSDHAFEFLASMKLDIHENPDNVIKRVIARKGQLPDSLTIGKMEVVVKTMLNYLNDDEMKDFVVVLPLIINQMARAKASVG